MHLSAKPHSSPLFRLSPLCAALSPSAFAKVILLHGSQENPLCCQDSCPMQDSHLGAMLRTAAGLERVSQGDAGTGTPAACPPGCAGWGTCRGTAPILLHGEEMLPELQPGSSGRLALPPAAVPSPPRCHKRRLRAELLGHRISTGMEGTVLEQDEGDEGGQPLLYWGINRSWGNSGATGCPELTLSCGYCLPKSLA